MFNKKLQILILSIFSTTVFAEYKGKCPSPTKLAQVLLKMELHGHRSSAYSSCLNDIKNKFIWVRPEQNDEGLIKPTKVDFWINDDSSIKITSVNKINYPERYEIIFNYMTDEGLLQKDKMIIETFEGVTKKLVGCAVIVTPPKYLALVKTCKKKN